MISEVPLSSLVLSLKVKAIIENNEIEWPGYPDL